MKKCRRSHLLLCMTFVAFILACAHVNADWSSQITINPPAWGGSEDDSTYVTKISNSSSFWVYGVKESNALDPSVRLINSNGETRSGWAAVRQGRTTTRSDNGGMPNYMYRTRAKTAALEPNCNYISYQFNPN